jgi:ABC-2 type transport system permease protein
MNIQANAMPESSFGSQVSAATPISATRRMYWSVRRELWENRSLYLAPLAVAVLILLGFLISAVHLPAKMQAAALDPMRQHQLIEQPYTFAALLLMFTTLVVGVFYCLDALYGERRDRSVLFWKSLPVSDLTTVLSKASIPIVIIPLLTFAITVVTQAIMLLIGSARLLGSGSSVATLRGHLALFQMWLMLLYHLVALHGLWWAPFWGWLLLVSAWSRRAPFLWATLPLLAIGLVEKITFNTSYFGALLQYRFMGGPEGTAPTGDPMSMASLTPIAPAQFLLRPGLWIGLAIAAAFLAAAVRLRRSRGPI